jgi:hypothetical protein
VAVEDVRSDVARRRARGATAGLALLAFAAPAGADLPGDAERLARLWTLRGARVERLAPMFLEHGRSRAIIVPSEPAAQAIATGAVDPGAGCVTLAFVSVRTAEFLVGPETPPTSPEAHLRLHLPFVTRGAHDRDRRVHSAGGAAIVSRCGAGRAELGRVNLEMLSSRGAVEIVVARSDRPLGELREILPERASGPVAPRGDAGGPIEPGPLAERIARADRRARTDGAAQITRAAVRADPSGAGQFAVRMTEGCHRVEVMAEVPVAVPRRATDVDAEAHEPGGRLLARDHADVPDARLDFCLGEAGAVQVPFAGASGPALVTLSDARWAMPARVPTRWGARARGGLAAALFRRHAADPTEDPVVESLGVSGLTTIPIEVQPGRCYFAAVSLIRGDARSIRLAATIGDRVVHDDVIDRPEGAGVAFCARAEATATIDADVRGNSPWWVLAIWPMGAAPL